MSIFVQRRPRFRFVQLLTRADVAASLSQNLETLELALSEPHKSRLYRAIHLPKKRGGIRTVYQVDRRLRRLQLEIMESLRTEASIHPAAHGFTRGCSILTNASQHQNPLELINLDLEDFFGSITFDRVNRGFMSLGAGEEASDLLTKLCTLGETLPAGAATSPILSNIVSFSLDHALSTLATRAECVYTRYGDDIAISGPKLPPLTNISNAVRANDFRINENKTKIRRGKQPKYVTGLTVASLRLPHAPRLPRRLRRLISFELFQAHKRGDSHLLHRHPWDASRWYYWMNGLLSFAYSIEKEWVEKLLQRYPDGLPESWTSKTFVDKE